ncbi:hypothetical protein KKF91_06190 [Myxococcota bacterium]|nr:hypothetical protein [Myxococcota bacterium]MBU1430142.1 hypothetical protein [Myxococcota bacterium]MBU1900653.1 hypothetical protein [Myxococcota bacterium]
MTRSFGAWGLAALLLFSGSASARDPDGCLECHRYRGLSSLDAQGQALRLFSTSAEYYSQQLGPHARLACTDCHPREEVQVFPHEVKTRVDCTQACHLATPDNVERRFSHSEVARTLERSAHGDKALSSLPFDPPLLREGQSSCLYCHDEPLYLHPKQQVEMGRSGEPDIRCRSCHQGELPVDTAYFTQHVGARFEPQRPPRQLAQVCAVCHSDPVFLEKTGQHDAVASYLHSFHGKAQILGDRQAATCTDCHAGEGEDVHDILGKAQAGSAVNKAEVAETCRSARCHVGATPEFSAAAVHLEIDPAKRTPEYYLAVFFVLLTAGTIFVFLLMIILDLLGSVIRKHSHEDARRVALARKLLAHREGRQRLTRLTVHQRFQHWFLVITFATVAITGMGLKFADSSWAPALMSALGGLSVARGLHRIAGAAMLLGFGYHLIYLLVVLVRLRQAARREGRPSGWLAVILSTRIIPTPQDLFDFLDLWRHLLFLKKGRPRFGHFTFLEKFEYWAVTWGCLVIGLSGLALWKSELTSALLSGRVLNFAFIIHSDEAFLAVVYILAVHLFSVMMAPGAFPLSKGSLTGDAPPVELAEWHGGEVEALAEALKIEVKDEDIEHEGRALRWLKHAYRLSLVVVFSLVLYASLAYLFHTILTRDAAPTSITEIPRVLTVESLTTAHKEAAPLTRGPLAHYHQTPPWFEDDTTNDCTTSGCHPQLPHGDKVGTRAFLNMHATYIDCRVCHLGGEEATLKVAWFDLKTGARRDTPAVLRLTALLKAMDPVKVDEPQIEALRAALAEAATGGNAQLRRWREAVETTRPGSRVWQRVIIEMRARITDHLHGEYQAKIAVDEGEDQRPKASEAEREATARYLEGGAGLAEGERKRLVEQAHGALRAEGRLCTPCHTPAPGLIDYAALGYTAERIKALQTEMLARRMKKLQEGDGFHMKITPEGVH